MRRAQVPDDIITITTFTSSSQKHEVFIYYLPLLDELSIKMIISIPEAGEEEVDVGLRL